MYSKYFKRLIDIVVSSVGLIILLPLLVIISLLIKIDSPGPIFFKQLRLGLKGKKFIIYKFRSMSIGAEKGGVYTEKGDSRVTKVGKVIRATSVDELPQFINIIKGDMSIIGPRPTLTYHPWLLEEYTEQQIKRFDVRPGVTGWAQVNGRKEILWNQRIKYDIEYVKKISFLFDLKILLMTFMKVIIMSDNHNLNATVTGKKNNKEK